MSDSKKEISPRELDHLKTRLWKLPYTDRVEILAASIIENEREAFTRSYSMIKLATKMAGSYSAANKLRLSETLKNAADVFDFELKNSEYENDVH